MAAFAFVSLRADAQGLDALFYPVPDQPGQSRRALPGPALPSPKPVFELPAIQPHSGREQRLSDGAQFVVRRFDISGSSVFPGEELSRIAAPFIDRPIGNEDLEELRLRLTRHYVDAGYLNSGAVIPDQEVRDGVVMIRIVEGALTEVIVSGEHRFGEDYIASRLKLGAGHPLNVITLQQSVQLMLQNPQIERMNAELAPGAKPGESLLRVAVKEAAPYTFGISAANNRSPSVGFNRIEIYGAARNLLGRADAWTLRLGRTSGLDDYAVSASIPVTARDTSIALRYDRNNSSVVEEPFSALDITSRSETLEIGISHPWYRGLQQEFSLSATLSRRESETRLFGQPFSFSHGVQDGKSVVAALRLAAEWLDRAQDRVFSARGVMAYGLNALGSTINDGGLPDSRFVTRLAQVQWVRRLGEEGAQWIARGDLQSSNAPLLPIEKFALGGAESVRGFRESVVIRDKGWIGSLELRVPVGRLRASGVAEDAAGRVSLAVFADVGRAWDAGSRAQTLWGAGPGVRWDFARNGFAQIYWGVLRKKLGLSNSTLQDRGVHFRVGYQRPF